jgi:transposase InsO family protein
MSHGSARTTFHGRLLIVQRFEDGWKQAHIASAMGVSRQCVKRWIDRFAEHGEDGLHDRSSRPHSMPTKTSEEVEQKVLAARAADREGQDVLGPKVGVPPRTVARILRRHNVAYLRDCDPMTGAVIRSSKTTAVRYEKARPGELTHMDVKKLGKIRQGGGWKAHGREATEASKKKGEKVGYDYVHSLVDDYTRLAYSEVLPDEKGPTCAAFLARAAAYFADRGVNQIERLLTDNAWAYKYSLSEVCAELGIKQKFIKPHCPWQNGKVERFNRTLATEWAYRRPFVSSDERHAALAPWLEHYNNERRHSALGGKSPISRLSPT